MKTWIVNPSKRKTSKGKRARHAIKASLTHSLNCYVERINPVQESPQGG